MQLHLDSRICSDCIFTVIKAIQSVDLNARITMDLPKQLATIKSAASAVKIIAALCDAGVLARKNISRSHH